MAIHSIKVQCVFQSKERAIQCAFSAEAANEHQGEVSWYKNHIVFYVGVNAKILTLAAMNCGIIVGTSNDAQFTWKPYH